MRFETPVVLAAILTLGTVTLVPTRDVAAQGKARARAESAARQADQDDEAEAATLRRSEAARRAAVRAAEAGHLDDPEGVDPLDDGDGLDDYDAELDGGGDPYFEDDLGEAPVPADEDPATPAETAENEADLDEVEAADDLDALESDAYLDAPSTADAVDDTPAGPSTSLEIFRAAERSLEGSGELGADYDDDFAGTLEIPGEE